MPGVGTLADELGGRPNGWLSGNPNPGSFAPDDHQAECGDPTYYISPASTSRAAASHSWK